MVMRDALIDEIKYLGQQCPFSFLLITGDISNKNKGYKEAQELIHRIVECTQLNSNRAFIVPGNHDLDRDIPIDREIKVKEAWNINILDKSEQSYIDALLPSQRDFFNAYETILGRKYEIDKLHFHYDIDEYISIIHLNTSWMCYDSENESGKLHIGLNNVYNCLKSVESKPIKIIIAHHRISDFNLTVENHLKSMFKAMDVDLYLGGHCHNSSVIYDPAINTEFCSCRQARAEEENYPAGFVVGDINTENDQSSFLFYGWDSTLAKWTYDYTVSPAKHGKYYLRGEKFTKEPEANRNIIVDLKLFGIPLDYDSIMNKYNINGSAIFRSSIRDVRPKSLDEWNVCWRELKNIYNSIIKDTRKCIHIFPIALIPLLVSFGYLIQNNDDNIKIYQYFENRNEWVFDERNDNIPIITTLVESGSKKLALALSISGIIDRKDIEDILHKDFDLLSVEIDNPVPSKLNYHEDVLRAKLAVKSELDKLNRNYDEIHLFLAAPAGLCIEIGRIIRENMYPSTYVYNYNRTSLIKYSRVFNLKEIIEI